GEQPGDGGHLRFAIDADAAHDVVRGRADLHRLLGDVDAGELLELVIHARKLLPDAFCGVRKLLLDPGDVEEDASVRAAAALADLADDAAGDVVAREQLRRAVGILVAHDVAPALLDVLRRLVLVGVGDVVEHEALALAVHEPAALAADAL